MPMDGTSTVENRRFNRVKIELDLEMDFKIRRLLPLNELMPFGFLIHIFRLNYVVVPGVVITKAVSESDLLTVSSSLLRA